MPPKFSRMSDGGERSGYHDVERTWQNKKPCFQALLDPDSEEDDFFLNGPRVSTKRLGDPKIGRLQTQVNDVVDVMRNNVDRVIERGDRLEDLQDKSDSLATNSDMFRNRAKALHKNMWWQNCKMRLIMAFVIILILSIIIIPIIVSQVNKNKN